MLTVTLLLCPNGVTVSGRACSSLEENEGVTTSSIASTLHNNYIDSVEENQTCHINRKLHHLVISERLIQFVHYNYRKVKFAQNYQ